MSISWKASLPMSADGHVAGDRDHRDGVEHRGADPGDEVGGARAGGAHAHANLAGHPGIAVRGMGAALLVANEDVAELGVVAEDVVEREDDAAGVREQDVNALPEERLADDVGADPRALAGLDLVEHLAPGMLDRGRRGGPVARDVAAAGSGRARAGTARLGGLPRRRGTALGRPLRHRHRVSPFVARVCSASSFRTNNKTLASRRGSLWFSVALALPPRSSVLPPGAGNKAEKAIQPKEERAKKGEKRYINEPGVAHRQVHAAAIRRDDDGDATAIPSVEQAQVRLRVRVRAADQRALPRQSSSLRGIRNRIRNRLSATARTGPGRAGPDRMPSVAGHRGLRSGPRRGLRSGRSAGPSAGPSATTRGPRPAPGLGAE